MFRRMYLCLSPQFTNHIKYYKISKYEYLLKVGGNTGRTDGNKGKTQSDTLSDPSTQRSHPFKI